MLKAPIGKNEEERLQQLLRYKVLDTTEEQIFDDITQLASSICNTPLALISLIDTNRQWFKSHFGIDAKETPRDVSFCGHAIQQTDVFEVKDALKDERFFDNPLVTAAPTVRFYAGAPLIAPSGHAIGTLCVVDHMPSSLSDTQKKSLETLGKHIISLLELKISNEEEKAKYNHLNSLNESMDEGMVYQDKDSKIIEFNTSALRVLGLTEDQLLGKTSFDPSWKAVKEDGSDFPGSEHPSSVALKTGEKQKNIQMGVHRPNGEICWISINATPTFENNSKTASHVLCTFNDITDRKKIEDSLKTQTAKMMYATKMSALGEMAAGMAHEINNPLAIISGYAGIIRDQLKKDLSEINIEKVRDKINQIQTTVERIAKIVKGLRSFSRNSENDEKFPVVLSKVIDDTIQLCVDRFRNKSIEIKIIGNNDTQFMCRESQISQVFLNLLNNAHDAIQASSSPWVEISSSVKGNLLTIYFTDSGTKIPPDIQQKMMQPFFTTKDVGKGTGLGLSISQGLIESNGGRLYYDKESPRNTFVIEIPLHD